MANIPSVSNEFNEDRMGFEQNQKWDEISNHSIHLLSDYMRKI